MLVVTPLAGVWIEIGFGRAVMCATIVTPLAGVWIEIHSSVLAQSIARVTPLAGVWIEMWMMMEIVIVGAGHPPRGGVDRNELLDVKID